jgi:hypothetical protein
VRQLKVTATPPLKSPRSCGECTACCTVLEVPFAGERERCRHELPKGGCEIYGEHPVECQSFWCAWLWGLWDEEDRPDQSGVIIDPDQSVKHKQVMLAAREVRQGAGLAMAERLQKLSTDGFKVTKDGKTIHQHPVVALVCADGDRFDFYPDGRVHARPKEDGE